MAENFKSAVTITLTILLGIGLQVVLALSEMTDTPSKAATEFAEAYFKSDPAMKDRLCADLLDSGEGDIVAAYINRNRQKAADLGYTLCYAGDRVKHITTKTVSMGQDRAVLEVEAELKNGLRSFFTGEKAYEVHEEFHMVKEEDGRWKVCGNPFMIAGCDYVVASAEPEEAVEAVEQEAVEEEAVDEEAVEEEAVEPEEEVEGEEHEG